MLPLEKTLTEFIIGEQRRFPAATGGFTALLNDIRLACKRVAYLVGKGALAADADLAGTANQIFLRTNEWGEHLAGIVSTALEFNYLTATVAFIGARSPGRRGSRRTRGP